MEETVIGTFDDVKFIEGVTKMNQTNWQDYFRHGFKDGVYEGLNVEIPDFSDSAEARIYDGTAFIDGLCVTIKTDDGYTTFTKESATDRLFCLRVYLNEQTAKLIEKKGITTDSADASVAQEFGKFFLDESYQCERSDVIYDIPLRYAGKHSGGYNYFYYGVDLRRMINTPRELVTDTSRVVQISKNNIYKVVANQYLPGGYACGTLCCPDLVNITDSAIISVTGGEYPDKTLDLSYSPYLGYGWADYTRYDEYIEDFGWPVKIKYKTKSDEWFNGNFGPKWRFENDNSTLIIKLTYLGYEPDSSNQSDFGKGTYTFFVEELES